MTPAVRVRFGDIALEAKAIVFDKDGTLIAFDALWSRRYLRAIRALADAVDGSALLLGNLQATLGFDFETKKTNSYGPLASVSLRNLSLVAATVVHQHGVNWDNAVEVSERFFLAALSEPAVNHDIVAIADPRALFAALTATGAIAMVATTDDRNTTVRTLKTLEIFEFVAHLLCGDDNQPVKPSPEAIHRLAVAAGIDSEEIVVVGDTVADMRMANEAGATAVGVSSGATSAAELAPWAHTVIASIADITIERKT